MEKTSHERIQVTGNIIGQMGVQKNGKWRSIQLDFQLPLRFRAEYIGADGKKHSPIMIHRVVYGSLERFIGILIEHYAGKFPL